MWTTLIVTALALTVFVFGVNGGNTVEVNKQIKGAMGASLYNLVRTALNLPAVYDFKNKGSAICRTAKGTNRHRLAQTFAGMDVINTAASVEVTPEGFLIGSVYGYLASGIEYDIPDPNACQQTGETMLNIVAKDMGLKTVTQAENLIIERRVFMDDTDTARLVYVVEFFIDIDQDPHKPYYIIDACNLKILVGVDNIENKALHVKRGNEANQEISDTELKKERLRRQGKACTSPALGLGGNEKTGEIVYGVKPYCLPAEVKGDMCSFSNSNAEVLDMNTTWDIGTLVRFNCSTGYTAKGDAVNGAYGVANDAFYFADNTGRMFKEWYGYTPFPRGVPTFVHYGKNVANAYWTNGKMEFGDGDIDSYPWVSQDVVAHEYAHAVTEFNSHLIYINQPGGIDEAFSDITGEVAEVFARGYNDWMFAYEITKGPGAMRYFNPPSKDGNSIDNVSQYYDGMPVHYSSGIFRRALYQLVAVQGLPARSSYECFLEANRCLWAPDTKFQTGACDVLRACYDQGYNITLVSNAFRVVGIDLSSCSYKQFAAPVRIGSESINDILVSSLRNPKFVFDDSVTAGTKIKITATSADVHTITVSVTSDAAGDNVVSSGVSPLDVSVTAQQRYFKLSSMSSFDLLVTLNVDKAN